jgi:hypothetical protein
VEVGLVRCATVAAGVEVPRGGGVARVGGQRPQQLKPT